MIRAGILTLSDKGSRGEREDLSGPEASRMLREAGIETVHAEVVPDEAERIAAKLVEFADARRLDLVVTTGGTGVSPRDVTPDATLKVIDREIPGMAEAMRRESMLKTPHAMISRAVAGIRGQTLIVNLPGSPKGVRENLAVILPALTHAIEKIKGDPRDCAT
ncbi:MAG TPA: MogA/MoaB family molybdenum cofactor biosynthesis protein [Syntrophales bacterium]|nr:MogA/MoaB family molybdenum cofactor biosynthesis protein [Syntrophaceae bacterium]MBP7033622.1 MogA/MoaB family molybdenum cofactor biosynthesis protein [Syntrophobacterales bacterium]HNU86093.1 MogA/MoaB family molybdenum cofactor biosynthesis protein [Syntrophales bacterium]HNZ35522.1 MogA/MoaB family molybdenum cofactor biosynthesis protein [Syntrophales bacterium]HOF74621.1 MogA/MoaB family molybdenum cofactor biosynthesis protein [Syntrophales bacterium]